MDGVKVTGTATRTCRYEGIGPDTAPKYSKIGKIADDAQHISRAEAVEAAQAAMLTLLDTCSIIAEPDTPVEPETVTVTVVDNGEIRELAFERGNLTGKLEYAGADGMRFAGWFADEACTRRTARSPRSRALGSPARQVPPQASAPVTGSTRRAICSAAWAGTRSLPF